MERAAARSARAAEGEMGLADPAGGGSTGASVSMTSTRARRIHGSSVRSAAQMSGTWKRAIDAQAGESANRVKESLDSPAARTCGIEFRPRMR